MVSWGELFSTFLVRKIMRAKHSFCSPNRGGVSLVLCSLHIAKGLPFCLSHPLRSSIFSLSGQIFGKKGQKLDFIWCALVFSRCFARPKGAKSKYIFESEGKKTGGDVVACLPFGVPTGCRWSGNSCYFADVSKIGQDSAGCSAFCPLSRFAFGALACRYAFVSRFKRFSAGFGVLVWVCIVRVLCVACGAFVCVSG